MQFRGDLTRATPWVPTSSRAGVVVDPGSKVTYNGVEISRVSRIGMVNIDDNPKAKLTLDVDPRYLKFIPANVVAEIRATTMFGNKYIRSAHRKIYHTDNIERPRPGRRIVGEQQELDTRVETVTAIAEQVDPIKLDATLTATADALTGLGDGFGNSLISVGNRILEDLNGEMLQIRYAGYPEVWPIWPTSTPTRHRGWGMACRTRSETARTFNDHSGGIDSALMASIGFAGDGHRQHRAQWTLLGARRCRSRADGQVARRLSRRSVCTIRNVGGGFRSGRARCPAVIAVVSATSWALSGARAIRTSTPTTCRA